jgi:KDO2-lipid IV(A) lauroyltransferase
MAFPEKPDSEREAILDGTFRSIGRVLLAFARFPSINRQTVGQWIHYHGYEHFEAALARGKGVLFATGHLGTWELSAFSHALMSAPMGVVVRPLDNPHLDAFVERRRGLSGNRLIGKRDFARPILQALRRNEAVGILVDQNVVPEDGAFVDFFGKLACSGTTFARLAFRSGSAVIPGFAFWSDQEQRHILHFYPEIPMTGDLEADTAAIQKAVEKAIREHPDQWLWIHRRWKTRPPGEAAFY